MTTMTMTRATTKVRHPLLLEQGDVDDDDDDDKSDDEGASPTPA
jgi:hypothetical protein